MSDQDVKSIALFFFYAWLDDQKATRASSEAIEFLRNKFKSKEKLEGPIAVVIATKYIWDKHKHRWSRGKPNYSVDSGWMIPDLLNFSPWKEFQKSSSEEELICLIWSKILKFEDEQIANGLGISIGTVRYRVGRGLRKLGALVQPSGKKARAEEHE